MNAVNLRLWKHFLPGAGSDRAYSGICGRYADELFPVDGSRTGVNTGIRIVRETFLLNIKPGHVSGREPDSNFFNQRKQNY
jgi:hypothetical protein